MNNKGFTLVEVLITLTISMVIGVLLLSVFYQNSGLYSKQSTKISQGLSISRAAREISDTIKSSAAVVNVNPIGSTSYTTSSSSLVLSTPSVNAQGGVISNVFDYVVIARDISSTKILRKYVFVDPASSRKEENKVLSTNLNDIIFLFFDDSGNVVSPTAASKINFSILLDEKAGNSNQQSSASGQINLRNN